MDSSMDSSLDFRSRALGKDLWGTEVEVREEVVSDEEEAERQEIASEEEGEDCEAKLLCPIVARL